MIEGKANSVSVQGVGKSRFAVGQRVFHQKFGYGHVKATEGQKLTVAFEHTGEKKVIDQYLEAA